MTYKRVLKTFHSVYTPINKPFISVPSLDLITKSRQGNEGESMPRKKYKTSRPGKPIDGEKVIRIAKRVLEQRQSKELEMAEKRETTAEKDMHKTGWGLPPKLPGSAMSK
tara:strand:+ start:149 stop:478 length:330 start_codon:yes stop_codon:yes gene_type:complete